VERSWEATLTGLKVAAGVDAETETEEAEVEEGGEGGEGESAALTHLTKCGMVLERQWER
jgi:hypothetical protein